MLATNRRGIVLMCAAMACFIINDTLVKWVSQALPSAQIIFIRGVMATLLVWAVARASGQRLVGRELIQGPVAVRSLVEAAGSLIYLISLFNLPLANATAINMAAPLVLTVLAVLFLHEQVGASRWVAVALGFAGVLFIIQPSASGFNGYAWLCLAGTLFHSARDLLTRRISPSVPSIAITLAAALSVTIAAGVWSLFQGWVMLNARTVAALGLASVFLATGYHCIISSMRQGDMSVVAPFRYVGLLFAVALGYLVWGDVPNAMAWFGIALLVGSGLYLLHGPPR